MQGSQLRKRPKLWALIEASTERHSREVLNEKEKSLAGKRSPKSLKKKNFKLPKLEFDKTLISFKKKKKDVKLKTQTQTQKQQLYFDFTAIPSNSSSKQQIKSTSSACDETSDFSADVTTPNLDVPETFNIEGSQATLARKSDGLISQTSAESFEINIKPMQVISSASADDASDIRQVNNFNELGTKQ